MGKDFQTEILGVLVSNKLVSSDLATKKVNSVLGCNSKRIASRLRKVVIPFRGVRPHLEN